MNIIAQRTRDEMVQRQRGQRPQNETDDDMNARFDSKEAAKDSDEKAMQPPLKPISHRTCMRVAERW